jgi:hypothetical protein
MSLMCHLGAAEGGVGEVGASLEVAELFWETPGLHTMVSGCEATSTALQPEGELLELIFEVLAVRIFTPVSYHFGVCSPVREVMGRLGQHMIRTIRTLEELEEPLFHRFCGFLWVVRLEVEIGDVGWLLSLSPCSHLDRPIPHPSDPHGGDVGAVAGGAGQLDVAIVALETLRDVDHPQSFLGSSELFFLLEEGDLERCGSAL